MKRRNGLGGSTRGLRLIRADISPSSCLPPQGPPEAVEKLDAVVKPTRIPARKQATSKKPA